MKIRINKDKLFYAIVMIYVFATIIVDVFRKLGNEHNLEILRNGIYFLCFLFVIFHIYTTGRLGIDIIIMLLFPLQAFVTLLIMPKITPVLSFFILYYYSRDFVGYYLFSRLNNVEILKNNKWFMLIITLVYSMMIILQGFSSESYMPSSYNLIIPTCILLFYGLKDLKVAYILVGGISCLTILAYGARGALFCVGVGVILFFINNFLKEKVTIQKIILITSIALVFIVTVINFSEILEKIYEMTGSRTVRLILTGNIVNNYGRDKIYGAFRNAIMEEPFKYRGILSDRILAAQMMNQTVSRGTYAHNIIYEILYEYGVLLGSIILLFIVFALWKSICKIINLKNDDLFLLFISIFPAGFCSLFFSGSYLNTHYFWMLAGLMYNIIRGNFSKLS